MRRDNVAPKVRQLELKRNKQYLTFCYLVLLTPYISCLYYQAMQASLLIIEDEPTLADLMAMYFRKEGIAVTVCLSAEEAVELLEQHRYDLITLDINLPEMDGFEFLQRFQQDTPVMVVSAREADEDIVLGLGLGAVVFVPKPFTPKVLVAQVRALLRRQHAPNTRVIRFANYEFDAQSYLLKQNERRIALSVKECELLRYLVENAGEFFSSDVLYEAIWENTYGDLAVVAVYIQRLRKKIEANPKAPHIIQTMVGKGYRFNPEVLR